jgi:multimeric flavodoxin WrbA
VVDEAAHRRSTARELARWVRQGCSIERIETASVRRGEHSLKPCAGNPNCVAAPHRRRQSARQQSLL